jgi:hypothetical protein
MSRFLKWLNGIDFRKLVWSVPIVLFLHEMEEWNQIDWYHRHNVNIGQLTNLDERSWLLFLSILGFVWTACSLIPRSAKGTAYIMTPLMVIIFADGIRHLLWVVSHLEFQPGFIFGTVITFIVCTYLFVRAVKDKLIPIWYPLVLTAVIFIPVIIDTVSAAISKTESMVSHNIREIAKWLAYKLSN